MMGQTDFLLVYPGDIPPGGSGSISPGDVSPGDAAAVQGSADIQYTVVSADSFAEHVQSVRSGFAAVCLLLGIITGILVLVCFWHGRMR